MSVESAAAKCTEGASPSIMTRLREETSAQHAHAESRPLEQALFRGSLPRAAFVALLGQRYLIHRHLEALIARLSERFPFVGDLIEPCLLQTENLRADLRWFGTDPDSIAALPETRAYLGRLDQLFASHPQALLGAYYVFEGSKNGARILARIVAQAYSLSDGNGLRYLDPHGADQRALWTEFKSRMDAATLEPADRDAIVEAAKATFDSTSAIDDELFAAHVGGRA